MPKKKYSFLWTQIFWVHHYIPTCWLLEVKDSISMKKLNSLCAIAFNFLWPQDQETPKMLGKMGFKTRKLCSKIKKNVSNIQKTLVHVGMKNPFPFRFRSWIFSAQLPIIHSYCSATTIFVGTLFVTCEWKMTRTNFQKLHHPSIMNEQKNALESEKNKSTAVVYALQMKWLKSLRKGLSQTPSNEITSRDF